jgi:hypothetical protein
MFHAVLNSMEKIRPNIRTIVYGKRPSLTVITKVPCCNASPKDLGTSPHYDKSAPSLILDHDDLEKENLVLSAQHPHFILQDCLLRKGCIWVLQMAHWPFAHQGHFSKHLAQPLHLQLMLFAFS